MSLADLRRTVVKLCANIASSANSGATLPQIAAMMLIIIGLFHYPWLTGLRTRLLLVG
jgi:hypothetical protein